MKTVLTFDVDHDRLIAFVFLAVVVGIVVTLWHFVWEAGGPRRRDRMSLVVALGIAYLWMRAWWDVASAATGAFNEIAAFLSFAIMASVIFVALVPSRYNFFARINAFIERKAQAESDRESVTKAPSM